MQYRKHSRANTIRLTINISKEQYEYLKILAAQKKISINQYVIEYLKDNICENAVPRIAEKTEFKSLLKEIIDEDDDILRRLV